MAFSHLAGLQMQLPPRRDDARLESGGWTVFAASLQPPFPLSLALCLARADRTLLQATLPRSAGRQSALPLPSSLSPVPRSVLLPVPPLPSLCGVSFGVLPACRSGAPFFPLLYADPTPC